MKNLQEIAKEAYVDDSVRDAKIRKYTNKKRGTELNYATIPISEAEKLRKRDSFFRTNHNYDENLRNEITKKLGNIYGSCFDYDQILDDLGGFAQNRSEDFRKEVEGRFGIFEELPREELIALYHIKGKPTENYFSVKKIGSRLLITPSPVIHNIMGHRIMNKGMGNEFQIRKREGKTQFDDLLDILNNGFESYVLEDEENAYVKMDKNHRINHCPPGEVSPYRNKGVTKGDVYGIEMFPKNIFAFSGRANLKGKISIRAIEASPENIASVNIQLAGEVSEDEKEKRMRFYKEQLGPLRISHRFFTISEDAEGKPIYKRIMPSKGLGKKSY